MATYDGSTVTQPLPFHVVISTAVSNSPWKKITPLHVVVVSRVDTNYVWNTMRSLLVALISSSSLVGETTTTGDATDVCLSGGLTQCKLSIWMKKDA
jgi:hypothetical protein